MFQSISASQSLPSDQTLPGSEQVQEDFLVSPQAQYMKAY